jgi:hypothetical protein
MLTSCLIFSEHESRGAIESYKDKTSWPRCLQYCIIPAASQLLIATVTAPIPTDCLAAALSQTPDHLKTPTAEEAFNPNGLSQRTISLLKDAYPDLEVRGEQQHFIMGFRLLGASLPWGLG